MSNVMCTTFLFLGNELAAFHNEGSMRPIHVVTKKGTLVDCTEDSLVAESPAVTGALTIEAIFSVLSKALPGRAIATYARLSSPVLVGRDDSLDGVYVYSSFSAVGGAGAVYGFDGYQCACDMGTLGVVGKTDAEEEMVRFPWDILQYEFRTDSHGAGKWRGAPGIVWEGVNEDGDCVSTGGPWSGFSTRAPGQHGGEPTPLNKAYILRGTQRIEITEPRKSANLKPGDHLITLSGGGAGVGKPEERDPEAVLNDVRNELVSIERARKVYKVEINPEAMAIDWAATGKLRGGK